MRIYKLTKLGIRITSTKSGNSDEMRILQFLRDNGTATDSELEVVGGERFVVNDLINNGLIKELTT